MTFDEAIEHFRNNTDISGTAVFLDDVEDTLKELREEYAPTIEMTQEQINLIFETQDDDRLYEIMGTVDGYYFDSTYWCDLEPHEVAQAYLHPETIIVVDK